jgi:hypothetical protein
MHRADVLREFADGLADRINRHVPGYGMGRKWSSEWQGTVARLAHMVNTPRVRVYVNDCHQSMHARLVHRLSVRDD